MRIYTIIRKQGKRFLAKHPSLTPKVKNRYWQWRHHWYVNKASKVPVNEKTIVFGSFMGRSYSCSPRALYEAMILITLGAIDGRL